MWTIYVPTSCLYFLKDSGLGPWSQYKSYDCDFLSKHTEKPLVEQQVPDLYRLRCCLDLTLDCPHTQKRKQNRTKCAYKSARFGNINLSVFVSVMLEIPSGGAKLTELPDARGDERHHENKMVWWLIQGLKIGQKKSWSTWSPASVG